jgi:hypothetical protein
MSDIDAIEEMLDDYFALQTRDVDNSGYTSSSSYTREYDRIGKERGEAQVLLNRIRQQLGE